MEITITVSEKIYELAKQNGKDVTKFVEEVLEQREKELSETLENGSADEKYENPFTPFIGMFSSGKTDTSERMHEILYSEDFDSAEGFSVKK